VHHDRQRDELLLMRLSLFVQASCRTSPAFIETAPQ
jgi:hypothetical protein